MDDDFRDFKDIDSKLSKGIRAFFITVFIFSLCAGVYFGGNFLMKTFATKDIYEILLDKCTKILIKNENKLTNAIYTYDGKLDLHISDNDIKVINELNINGTLDIDRLVKYAILNINSNYGDKELLKSDIIFKDNNSYLLLNDIYDKYIKFNMSENQFNSLFDNSSYEIKKELINDFINILKKSLKDEYFSNDIAIVNKKPCVSHNLILTDKELINLIKNIIIEVTNDDISNKVIKLFDIYGYDLSKDKLNDTISFLIKKLDSIGTNNNSYKLSIYLGVLDQDIEKITFKCDDINYEINKVENDRYYMEFIKNNVSLFYGRVSTLDNEKSVNFHINNKSNEYDISVLFINENENKSLNIDFLDKNIGQIKLGFNYSYLENEIEEKNIKNVIEKDKVSDKDIEKINYKLSKTDSFRLLKNDVKKIYGIYKNMLKISGGE